MIILINKYETSKNKTTNRGFKSHPLHAVHVMIIYILFKEGKQTIR